MNPVLKVENLKISFANAAVKTVVNELSFVLYPKSTLAIVGESGSGKSITALALMGLLPKSLVAHGSALLHECTEEIQLLNRSIKEWQSLRGKQIALIFQEPMSALNPSMTIGNQIKEAIAIHQNCTDALAEEHAKEEAAEFRRNENRAEEYLE